MNSLKSSFPLDPPALCAPAAACPALPLQYVFMDMQSYEETRITKDEDWAK